MRAAPKPLPAALALAALEHPAVVADKIERISLSGFGDPQLDGLAGELVAASFEGEGGDPASLRRRLAAHGYDESVFDRLARAAEATKAAFLAPNISPQDAQALWARAFDALMELGALERAVDLAKEDLARDADSATLMKLKLERDVLARAISSGEIWGSTEAVH
jgi:DNA primase